jgi:hypothetical protein
MEIDLGILGSERMGDDLVEIEQGDRVGLGSLSAGARGSFIGKWVVYERQRPGRIALILVGESLGFYREDEQAGYCERSRKWDWQSLSL